MRAIPRLPSLILLFLLGSSVFFACIFEEEEHCKDSKTRREVVPFSNLDVAYVNYGEVFDNPTIVILNMHYSNLIRLDDVCMFEELFLTIQVFLNPDNIGLIAEEAYRIYLEVVYVSGHTEVRKSIRMVRENTEANVLKFERLPIPIIPDFSSMDYEGTVSLALDIRPDPSNYTLTDMILPVSNSELIESTAKKVLRDLITAIDVEVEYTKF